MMLTLEDVNTANLGHINEFYTCKTGEIGVDAFTLVQYDFMNITHSISSDTHTFTFEIHNNLWTGGYTVLDEDDELVDATVTYDDSTKTLTVVTSESSIQLVLYICSYATDFVISEYPLYAEPNNNSVSVKLNEVGTTKTVTFTDYETGDTVTEDYTVSLGVVTITPDTDVSYYVLCELEKTDVMYNLNQELIVGLSNKVYIGVESDYLPSGSLVDEDLLDLEVVVGGETLKVEYDQVVNDYFFVCDLTEKFDTSNIKVQVNVYETDTVNPTLDEVYLSCKYAEANSIIEFETLLNNGIELVKLTNDITLTNTLLITHDLQLIGDNYTIDCAGYNITLDTNTIISIEDTTFNNGLPVIQQRTGSKLTMKNCTFNDCIISDTVKGGVIQSISDNTTAIIDNCTFNNSPHSIYYEGDITITNCNASYTDMTNIDTDYPLFLSLYMGNASITYSNFNIELETQEDIRFASSLIGVGDDCTFNNYQTSRLLNNNSLPFFNEYNNTANTRIQYYYTDIMSNVILEPFDYNYNNKNVCHMVIGTDFVFKNNCRITRLEETNNEESP